jgi:hypothetical protein
MANFILQYAGERIPTADLERIRDGVRILDESSTTLLVDAQPRTLDRILATMPYWTSSAEQRYRVPTTRRSVRPRD